MSSYWTIVVSPASPALDGAGRDLRVAIEHLGMDAPDAVATAKVYLLEGELDRATVATVAAELLADPVAERFEVAEGLDTREPAGASVEVQPLPGVMDPVALTTQSAVARMIEARGWAGRRVDGARTARRYVFNPAPGAPALDTIARRLLHNPCIERAYIRCNGRDDALPAEFPSPIRKPFKLRHVSLAGMSAEQLAKFSREKHLFLSADEMLAIQAEFERLGRDPTDLELETLAQTWSEHCVHKTLKSAVTYRGEDFGRSGSVEVQFSNLFKDTIVAATRKVNKPWCLSVFHDNAGVIAFDDEYGVAFKVETHNHPSAIEPYGGAATGVGGCIRDIMGCGLGAKPIASTDVFCLAEPDYDDAKLPTGVLHPRRVLRGVVGGVRDYGNRMGIPTVNGAIYFDSRYLANPLVFCGCVGLIPRNRIEKRPNAGDLIVVAGGRTGRDGIHGATFSSAELGESHADEFSHAVQIGNAVEEKKVLDALLLARDHPSGCLYSAVTDCGAGGLSSAVGEMGEHLGAVVDLEQAPLKYEGLTYDEIWISEAQERMVFAVPPDRLNTFLRLFADEEVEATVIGRFSDDRVLRVRYEGKTVGELSMAFLHDGLPMPTRTAAWTSPARADGRSGTATAAERAAGFSPRGRATRTDAPTNSDASPSAPSLHDALLDALGSLNVASKEWVIRQYDHEVQGRSVIKPLAGPGVGPSDAAVLRPRLDSSRGIVLGCGLCPHRADDDPYWMAIAAVDEALRNVICAGGDPDHTAILDNFCWPRCDSEAAMGTLVRACRGAADAAVAYGLPFISGKDSLNNEFSMDPAEAKRLGLPSRIAIPPTLLISAISVIGDVSRCVSMDLKAAGNAIVLASAPVDVHGLKAAHGLHTSVATLVRSGCVMAAHDVSDGGVAVALAEMCIAGALGVDARLYEALFSRGTSAAGVGQRRGSTGDGVRDGDSARAEARGSLAFAETATTYLLEVSHETAREVGWPVIARVTDEPVMRLSIGDDEASWTIDELAAAWRSPLAQGGA